MFDDKKPPKVLWSIGVSDDVIRYTCNANKDDKESLKEVIDLLELTDEKFYVEISHETRHNMEKQFEENINPALDERGNLGPIESLIVKNELDLEPAFWHGIPLEHLKPTMTLKIQLSNGDKVIVKSQDFKYEEKNVYKKEEG